MLLNRVSFLAASRWAVLMPSAALFTMHPPACFVCQQVCTNPSTFPLSLPHSLSQPSIPETALKKRKRDEAWASKKATAAAEVP